jgi:hypothetical protein
MVGPAGATIIALTVLISTLGADAPSSWARRDCSTRWRRTAC